jgi:hypothetical protein
MEKKIDLVKIELHPAEAHLLWNLLKDIMTQDQEGKDNGTGGVLLPKDVMIVFRVMENLAKELDTYKITNAPSKPILKLI